ncbi:MAG: PAS domain-containing sensor histidine kinase [Anaerolineae bacterium]|nr:PAS domain-containing sensor histidine kinase [Anaerolineae bacterium]
MRASRAPGPEIWRAVVEVFRQGVVLFDDNGVVVFANEAANDLLGYSSRDILDLDTDDFAALCYPDRMDGARFVAALGKISHADCPPLETETYQIVTAGKRLQVRLAEFRQVEYPVFALIMEEALGWRADLIAETVLGEELHSPLVFAASYSEMMIDRMSQPDADPFEVQDFARIIRDGVLQAMASWQTLRRLYVTSPSSSGAAWELTAVSLQDATQTAIKELGDWAVRSLPTFELYAAGDLPRVRASAPHLHTAIVALLDALCHGLTPQDRLSIVVRARHQHVEAAFWCDTTRHPQRNDFFDALPAAITEQVINQLGGRIWLGKSRSGASAFCFRLPVWEQPDLK